MKYYPLPIARLQALRTRWQPTIQRYKGAAPAGLGVAHMTAESNGTEDPVIRDTKRRPIGLMQVPYRTGRQHGYTEAQLKNATVNIYVWGLQTNKDADALHRAYPADWATPNLDFWCAVRLFWILGHTTFHNLYSIMRSIEPSYRNTAGIVTWTRSQTTRTHIGRYSQRDLRRIADHIEAFRYALNALEGKNYVTPSWFEGPAVTPGNYIEVLERGAL